MSPAAPPSGLASTTYGEHGPRLVLLHGLFGQGRNFTGVARALAADARVTLVDLPDHGRSPWSDAFSYVAMADQVAGYLAATGPGERWTVAGHSMGGKVAMLVALRHPGLVERLCVVDVAPVPTSAVSSFGTYVTAMRRVDLATLRDRATAEQVVAETVGDPVIRGFLLQNLRREGSGDAARWRWQMNLALLGDHLAESRTGPPARGTRTTGPCSGSPASTRTTCRPRPRRPCGPCSRGSGWSASRTPGTGSTPTSRRSSCPRCTAS